MKFDAFFGGSYKSQGVTADHERTVNFYPEVLQSQGAPSRVALYPTPGVESIGTGPKIPGRAHFYQNSREFAVFGSQFCEIAQDGTVTYRGSVIEDGNPASISGNGDLASELLITSGTYAYIYDLDADTLTQISALDTKATMGDYLDGYFLVLDSSTSTMYISALGDGTSWTTGTDFAQRSYATDRWQSMKVLNRYIWLLGDETSEAWYNTGATFPFAPHPSGVLNFGVVSPWSVSSLGDSLIWLAKNDAGRICVIRVSGFTPEIVSDYPLETELRGYTDLGSSISDVYSDAGHTFYLLSFDADRITWAWDSETRAWCERGSWETNAIDYIAWRPRHYVYAFNEHRWLDINSNNIWRSSLALTTDVDGFPIRRLRRGPAIVNEDRLVSFHSFEIGLDAGLATLLTTASAVISVDWAGNTETNEVTFDASATTLAGISSYAWNFGDGGGEETGLTDTENHTYDSAGSYTVMVTVVTTYGNYSMSFDVTAGSEASDTASLSVTYTVSERPPEVMLRFSNDGGRTWSNEVWRSAGKIGEYWARVQWNRLGAGRRRVFEVAMADSYPWRLTGCWLETEPTGA